MKRMIALFLMLTLVMLLMPTGVTASEKFAKKPYYLVNSSAVNVETGYAYDMPYFWGHPYPEGETKATVSAFHRTEPPYITISDYPRLTTMLKKEFEDRPEGTRYINFDLSSKAVYHLAEDYIYFGVATKSVYDWIEPFLAEYKRIGGTLDGVILDIEYIYGYNYYICTREYEQGNKDIYWEIVNHPQYKTLVRPMLVERGFRFWPESQQDSEKSEIWTMYARHGAEYAMERAIWDNVVDELLKKYANESVYEPLMKYFPDATLNDYDRRDSYGWQKALQYTFDPIIGNESKVGNVSNYNAYSYRPFKEGIGSYTTPASFNDVKFEATPFNIMMYEFFQCKTMYEPTDTKTISMWITFFNYSPNYPGTYSNTPYYAESIYHMGMMDPQPFLGYIVPEEVRDMGQYSDDPKVSSHDYCIEVVSELMAELTRVAGYADRKHIPTPINWNNDFLLTGMYAGGRNIWRITPDISKGVSLEKFKVKDKAPTFSIGGQTVIFPQGRIIEDSEISQVGTCGYWVETPADVTPVIIADTDRYANYPSVADNFESYAVNQTFSTSSSDLWSVVGVGAKIEYYKGDKALALNGNITLRDKKAAPNVTAGDSYALQQIWEVSFTGHSSGELKLL
ncbi:MAG: hypothetical protein IKK11_03660, partial [Oscillospiraceae bacterium]|nr:hypothetical protein [Oscillospiraceae bacterium]